ncbi:hypothetical protein BHS09_22055 [Myxococcus xanthus]|uniref:Uncharacterized protein n=1 Tax=Myxococcus xanthus TaxID=34 RepID=A0AAE6G1Z2_MYXXA|nr:hypothetical protein [Myxococcus xanthus]QDE69446.1 hypothetical protein BHS09_22055 [Myxococcus xanthus]QDE76723.1 hypothetical protein BHS08_22070 [Myxococcus xanthus]
MKLIRLRLDLGAHLRQLSVQQFDGIFLTKDFDTRIHLGRMGDQGQNPAFLCQATGKSHAKPQALSRFHVYGRLQHKRAVPSIHQPKALAPLQFHGATIKRSVKDERGQDPRRDSKLWHRVGGSAR